MTQATRLTKAQGLTSNDLLLSIVILIWGVNFTVIKLAMANVGPLAFNAVRFALAAVTMLAVLIWRREPLLPRRDIPQIILLAMAGHAIYQVVFISGMARTSPANASLLMATSPIFVAIYSHLLGLERNTPLAWAGIGMSFAGIILLIGGGPQGLSLGGSGLLGDVLILICAMLWAAYTAFSKPLLTRYSPVQLTTWGMAIGAVPLMIAGTPQLIVQDWSQVSTGAWLGVVYSGLLAIAFGYVAWYISVQRVGNTRTAIYSNLTPVVAVLVGWLVLGDMLRPLQFAGALVVLAGLIVTRRGRAR